LSLESGDECASAAEVYACTNKNNPTLTAAVVGNLNKSSPASADVKLSQNPVIIRVKNVAEVIRLIGLL